MFGFGRGVCFDQFFIIETCARLQLVIRIIYVETTDLETEKLEEQESLPPIQTRTSLMYQQDIYEKMDAYQTGERIEILVTREHYIWSSRTRQFSCFVFLLLMISLSTAATM